MPEITIDQAKLQSLMDEKTSHKRRAEFAEYLLVEIVQHVEACLVGGHISFADYKREMAFRFCVKAVGDGLRFHAEPQGLGHGLIEDWESKAKIDKTRKEKMDRWKIAVREYGKFQAEVESAALP